MFEFPKAKPKEPTETPPVEGPEQTQRGVPSADGLDLSMFAAAGVARSGDLAGAVAAYSRVIESNPVYAPAYYKRGNVYKDLGQWERAVENYDQAIALDPTFAHAFCNRGVVLDRLERVEEALASYDQALAIAPADALSHHNRAMVLRKLGRPTESLASFNRAIELNPSYAEAHCNRGTLLQDLQQWDAALASYARSIEIDPGLPLAYFNRGLLFQTIKNLTQSLADYDKAIALDPRSSDAHCNRGVLLGELNRPEEGLASFDRALELAPDSVDALFSRAETLMSMKRFGRAAADYDRAISLKRTHPFLLGSRRFAKMIVCDWNEFDSDVADLATGLENGQLVSTPFQIVALMDSPTLQHKAAQIWSAKTFPADRSVPKIEHPERGRRIHVGYFSADFREHPVSLLMAELFETHDRSKFEVTAFSFGADTEDPMRKRLERAFDRFIDARNLSDKEVIARARDLRLDIAVDLGGHTAEARTRIFAMRTAPIQVNYLGYTGTMGADYMDYLIADATVIPRSLSQHYTEQIVHLPHSFLPNDSRREIAISAPTREESGLPTEGFVFCCFNNSYKINPPMFGAWMDILGRIENSVLWLSHHHPLAADNLRREASQRGIDPARLRFANRSARQSEYLARLRLGDLFLDTLPYNAHTTAIDALWAGLPVLTRIGQGFAGRVGASLLRAIDLGELVTSTIQEYQDLAVDLAMDPVRLAVIRRRLMENRRKAPLFDTNLFTRHLESAYRVMHARSVAGLAAAPFCVDPIRCQHCT